MKKLITSLLFATLMLPLSAQWQLAGFPDTLAVRTVLQMGSDILVGTEEAGVFVSSDNGASWTQKNNGLNNKWIRTLYIHKSCLFAGTMGGVYRSLDSGNTWSGTITGAQILNLFENDDKLYACTWSYDGVLVSLDTGKTWMSTNLKQDVTSFVRIGNTLFVGTKNNYVHKSTDNFSSWTLADNNLTNPSIRNLVVVGTTLYAATDCDGVFKSTNMGGSWTPMNNGIKYLCLLTIKHCGSYLYATSGAVFRSKDLGNTWTESDVCMPESLEVNTITPIGQYLYAGTQLGLYRVDTNNILDRVEICMVGVNELNQNLVMWERPYASSYDSIYIHRETNMAGEYEIIARLHRNETTLFADTTSRPDVQSNKYKISYNTNCGLPLITSNPHKTMHLAINAGMGGAWNLIWDPYVGFPVSTYKVYRGIVPDSMVLIGSTSGGNTQYTDVTPPAGFIYYQVEVVKAGVCSPSKTYTSSRSNLASNKASGLTEPIDDASAVMVYPNPATDQIIINDLKGRTGEIRIYQLNGKLLKTLGWDRNPMQLHTSELTEGIYLLEVNTQQARFFKRVVIGGATK